MKQETKYSIGISLGYVLEVVFLLLAGAMFVVSLYLYFLFGIVGILVGSFVSYLIRMRERIRIIKNDNSN